MFKRGDIFFADMGSDPGGNKQCGIRPVVIVSNDRANHHSPVVTVIPLTANCEKKPLPTHVFVPRSSGSGLSRSSLALAEQVASVNKTQLLDYKGHIFTRSVMDAMDRALRIQLAL